MTARPGGARASPEASELLSLGERAKLLTGLRLVLGTVAIAAVALWPTMATVPPTLVVSATAAYLPAAIALIVLSGHRRRVALPLLQGGLLVDGIYVAAIIAFTGGASSPLRPLLFVHVVAVMLLCSYRTGLKLTLWHTTLFLLVVESIDAGILPAGRLPVARWAVTLTVGAIWVLALATAAFSAAGERELRLQKLDLRHLSDLVSRMDAATDAAELPELLLEELQGTFGFARGVVLASPEGDLEVVASTEVSRSTVVEGLDRVMARAWSERAAQLVRELDPGTDPRLASLLPDARNLLVVPLLLPGGHRLGIVVLERGGTTDRMHRWEVEMVGQFVAHGALALHNAWLTDDREAQLRRIRDLQRDLRAHNADLEVMVAERTEELQDVIRTLEETDRQRRRLLEHVVHATEDERRRIANDVHDDPVQKLAALKMRLEMLATSHPHLPDLEQALEVVTATIGSLRRMLFDLSPPILDEEGIGPALRHFLEHSPTAFRWSVEDDLADEPPARTRLILYRTAQEALTNVRKHARADHVRVRLQDRAGGVWMEIEDDGVGFQPQEALVAAPGHLGLAAMRERAEMAGGWCTLRSLPGAGTSLQVWLPDTVGFPSVPDEPEEDLAAVVALQDRIA